MILPIGPIGLTNIANRNINFWEVLSVVGCFVLVFLISISVLKRTPKYSIEDKKLPIYHILCFAVSAIMLLVFGWSAGFLKGMLFMNILLFASVCDIQTHEVKDFVSVMILLLGLYNVSDGKLIFRALGGLTVFGLLFLCAVISKNKLGGADVKLGAACTFLLGFGKGIAGLIIGLVLAVVCNLIINKKNKTKGRAFPLVPYLSMGFILTYII